MSGCYYNTDCIVPTETTEGHHVGNCEFGSVFTTLDSGERVDFPSGMRRDTDKGKARFDLIPLPMLRRLAELYARGAEKYGPTNWELANSPEEVARFKASAFRHFVSWLEGDRSEDHAIATVFNVFAAETIQAKLNSD